MEFTKEIKDHMKKYGWTPDRSDTSQEKFMQNYPKFLKDFLKEFGGLSIKKISILGHEVREANKVVFDINLTEGINGISEGYGDFFGRPLFPIGSYLPETYDIAVDESGYVYLIGEYCFCTGKEFHQGIECIIKADALNILELDPTNNDEVVWLEYKNGKSQPVDFESYEFNYDF